MGGKNYNKVNGLKFGSAEQYSAGSIEYGAVETADDAGFPDFEGRLLGFSMRRSVMRFEGLTPASLTHSHKIPT